MKKIHFCSQALGILAVVRKHGPRITDYGSLKLWICFKSHAWHMQCSSMAAVEDIVLSSDSEFDDDADGQNIIYMTSDNDRYWQIEVLKLT